MPRYVIRNLTANRFFVPQPVGEALGPHQTKVITVAAAEMDVPAIAHAISRHLISVESSADPFTSNQIEVPTASTSGGGGGGGVTSVTASLPLSSSGGATPDISLGTVGVAKGGTGQTSLTANAVVLGNGALAVQTVAPGTSGNVLTSNGTTWSSAPPLATEYDQQIFVSDGADPLVATGAPQRPFASVSAAMAAITDAAPTKRYAISVAAGEYTEASALNLKPNVFIIGISRDAVRITAPSFGLDASFTGVADNRSGVSDVVLVGACAFNWTTVTSEAGKLAFRNVTFNSAITLTGYTNSIAQAQFSGCILSGVFSSVGINVGVFSDNICYDNIVLTQSPSAVASFFFANGGYCIGSLTATTTVNAPARRISVYARSFTMNAVTVDGPVTSLDYTVDSIPAVGVTVLNGASTTSLNPPVVAPAGANTALSNLVFPTAVNYPIVPAATNATNSGDWDKQWMFAFNFVNLSSGSDLYVASAGTSAVPDSAGRSILVESDTYGLQANVNGGDISITTQAGVSGTGVRGQIALNARDVEICGAYTLPSVDGLTGQVVTTNGAGVSTWSAPTGGPPSGAAGGDLTGSTYPNPIISSFGGKIHWVVQGGKYATLQAAVDAAVAGDVIMVGPTATTWGPVTFPAQKELSVYGLSGAPHSNMISVGAITFSPAAGTAQQNQLWLANLYINGNFTGAQGVLFSGTAPGRFRMNGCFVSDSGTGNSIVSNNSGASSSFLVENCLTDAGDAVASPRLVHTQGYTLVQDTELHGGTSAFSCAGGVLEFQRVRCEYAVAGAVGAISGGTTVAQNLFIQNTTAGGDGVLMSGGTLVLNNSVFDVAVGAGYCVRGIGGFAYGQNTYTSAVGALRNVKVQVNGISNIIALPMTQAFTPTV